LIVAAGSESGALVLVPTAAAVQTVLRPLETYKETFSDEEDDEEIAEVGFLSTQALIFALTFWGFLGVVTAE
jgi:hypothetical protein